MIIREKYGGWHLRGGEITVNERHTLHIAVKYKLVYIRYVPILFRLGPSLYHQRHCIDIGNYYPESESRVPNSPRKEFVTVPYIKYLIEFPTNIFGALPNLYYAKLKD